MYPIIFEYNGLIISSYGLMLMLAFVICNYLLKKYLISINKDPKVGDDIIFYAAIGGIIGAKLYYIIEGIPTGEAKYNIDGLILIFKGVFSLSFEVEDLDNISPNWYNDFMCSGYSRITSSILLIALCS